MSNYFYWMRKKFYGAVCRIRGRVVRLIPNVSVDGKLCCERNVEFNTYFGGKIIIGNNCELRSGAKLLTHGGNITLGTNCSVNPYTILYGGKNLTIGNNVRIAAHCVIIPSNHNYEDPTIPIVKQGLSGKGITIEDDVWLGCGVKVLDGVTISKGCVIGAGSVVTKSTEPYGVYVGVPARRIKLRK